MPDKRSRSEELFRPVGRYPRQGEKAVIEGTVSRITYQDPAAPYTVARLEVSGAEEVTVVGGLFPLGVGEQIKVSGLWRVHPRYGLQLHVERWEKPEPATAEAIERYLGSGLIKGIGPAYAHRLVQAFGADTLKVLAQDPNRLKAVSGIGEVRARRIVTAWEQQKGMREAMLFLQGHGVSSGLALRIYRAFGDATVACVKEDPYRLAREVHGIGFQLADQVAQKLGMSPDSPLRIQAGMLHVLRKAAEEGHCFVPRETLTSQGSVLLGVEAEAAERSLKPLSAAAQIVVEEDTEQTTARVYLRELHQAEGYVAAAIRRLLSVPSRLGQSEFKSALEKSRSQLDLLLEAGQREAVLSSLRHKVLVITGGPGTGKTTLLTHLLALLQSARISFALAAPTGRAAKRMEEATGTEAKTLHRLLEYNPREQRFERGPAQPLEVDAVIIDEASMVDLPLMHHLMGAVHPRSHLILIGDVDQLPSVGPGNVLRDLIASGAVPVVTLRHAFRQASGSLIVANAQRILQGEPLQFSTEDPREFVFFPREEPQAILETLKEIVSTRLPRWLGTNPTEDVQVLSPMHRGPLGTLQLNRELQSLLNPQGEPLDAERPGFRLGDKVMQLRNNYDKGVFNGDLGRLTRIDREEDKIWVEFYGRAVAYEMDDLDELGLAYATSVHKSQGSEYPAVVMPLHFSFYLMLHRSILYTAVTRAKKLVVLIGSRRALSMALRNVRVEKRFTGLKEKLAPQ